MLGLYQSRYVSQEKPRKTYSSEDEDDISATDFSSTESVTCGQTWSQSPRKEEAGSPDWEERQDGGGLSPQGSLGSRSVADRGDKVN